VAQFVIPKRNPEYNRLNTRLSNPNLNANARSRIQRRFNWKGWQLPQQQAETTTTQQPAPVQATDPTKPAVPQGNPTGANTNALFPNVRTFLPENWQGSPMYKFQMGQATDQLNKLMAARGLTGSGAENQALIDASSRIGAQESDRMQQMAQTEADRLERMQEAQALRQERTGNNQFDRMMQLLNFIQNQSPMPYAMNQLTAGQNMTVDQANMMAKYLAKLYQRPTIGAGGGGNYQSMPPYIPPPQGKGFSAGDAMGILNSGNSTQGFGNAVIDFVPKVINWFS